MIDDFERSEWVSQPSPTADTGASASEGVSSPLPAAAVALAPEPGPEPEPAAYNPATAPALPEVRRPCAWPSCHRPAQRIGKLFGVQTRPSGGIFCWSHLITFSDEEAATRELLEIERGRLPELRASVVEAARAYIKTLSREDERARNAAQKRLADAEAGVAALQLELADTLARDAAAKSEEAREVRQNQREKLIALLERLKNKSADIAIAIANLLLLWNEDRELLGELRPYFTAADLDFNGYALGNALSAPRLLGLIETELARQGAPGAAAASLPLDYRQRPDALPPLEEETARIATLALQRFDGVKPAPARLDPPRAPAEIGSLPWYLLGYSSRAAHEDAQRREKAAIFAKQQPQAEPPGAPPLTPWLPPALSAAEKEAGFQRALAEIQARANPPGGRNVAA